MEMEKLVRPGWHYAQLTFWFSALFGANREECAAVCALTACKTMMDAKTTLLSFHHLVIYFPHVLKGKAESPESLINL